MNEAEPVAKLIRGQVGDQVYGQVYGQVVAQVDARVDKPALLVGWPIHDMIYEQINADIERMFSAGLSPTPPTRAPSTTATTQPRTLAGPPPQTAQTPSP